MIILKVTKSQGFNLTLEDTLFENPQGGVKLTPSPALAVLVLMTHQSIPNNPFKTSYSKKHYLLSPAI